MSARFELERQRRSLSQRADDKPIRGLMNYDEDKPDVVHAGTVSFYVIKRSDKLGIRAKDSASPVLKNFKGMKFFPIDPELHFRCEVVPDPEEDSDPERSRPDRYGRESGDG